MAESRRDFLARAAGVVSAAAAASAHPVLAQTSAPALQTTPAAGTPPAFGTAPSVGPEVAAADFAHAEKLVRLEMTPSEREQAAGNWREAMAGVMERRTGPRRVPLTPTDSPATRWDPRIPGAPPGPTRDRFLRSTAGPGPLPKSDEDIAFATVTALSRWIETRALTSERLTRIYLERIERFDPKLRCV
ncbi:MAG TPA: amidase, partial [Thermoanaerobaculia bacterium]